MKITARKTMRRRTSGSRPRKRAFVFAAVGDAHVDRVRSTIRFLKKFSRSDVVIVCARNSVPIDHDQVLRVDVPAELDDQRASIWLKTCLYRWTLPGRGTCCYLDTDVVAVRRDVDEIFLFRAGAVNFAHDHATIDQFSRWAVHCGCTQSPCGHLREAIEHHLGIAVLSGDWRLWNGGVYLYDRNSVSFLAEWHRLTQRTFDIPYWKARDQGTLAATVWSQRCVAQKPLPAIYNFIVDRMRGIPETRRAFTSAADYAIRDDFSLAPRSGKDEPRLIHFINGGVGTVGWRHWDDVRVLLDRTAR